MESTLMNGILCHSRRDRCAFSSFALLSRCPVYTYKQHGIVVPNASSLLATNETGLYFEFENRKDNFAFNPNLCTFEYIRSLLVVYLETGWWGGA